MFSFLTKHKTHILIFTLALILIRLSYQPVIHVFCGISSEQKIAIIMYHNLSEKPADFGKYVLPVQQFEKDLNYIQEHGYHTITMTQLIDYVYHDCELPEKPVIITFDDGYESFYAYAYPLLQKYNMTAVMSIVGEYTDLFTETEDHHLDYSHLNWTQVQEMSQSGYVEIQNHTYGMHKICNDRKGCGIRYHECLEEYQKDLNNDIGNLQQKIQNYTGFLPNTFTYPYGYICPESIQIIKEMGFQAMLTCTEHLNTVEYGTEWLYNLGRYNRPYGKTSEEFFREILNYD